MIPNNGRLALTSDIRNAVSDLAGPHGTRPVSEQRAHAVCERLAQQAYSHGRADALLSIRSANEAADELGISREWLHRLAKRHGIGQVLGRERLFLPDDIMALRAQLGAPKTGRPPIRRQS